MAAEDPELLTLLDLDAGLVPFEGHTRSLLDFTLELGVTTDVYLQRDDFLPEDGRH